MHFSFGAWERAIFELLSLQSRIVRQDLSLQMPLSHLILHSLELNLLQRRISVALNTVIRFEMICVYEYHH